MANLLSYRGTPEYQRKMARASRDVDTAGRFYSLLTRNEMDALEGQEAGGAFSDFLKLKQLAEMKKERETYMPERMGIEREKIGLRREELGIRSGFQEKELAQRLEQSTMMAGLKRKSIESEVGIRGSELEERERGMRRAFPWQVAGVGVSGLSAWQQIKQGQEERDWRLAQAKKFGLDYGSRG